MVNAVDDAVWCCKVNAVACTCCSYGRCGVVRSIDTVVWRGVDTVSVPCHTADTVAVDNAGQAQSCSSYIVKSRPSYFMLFGMEVVDSVFDLLPKKHKVGGSVTKYIALQSFHHGQNFTRSLYSHFALSSDKNYFSTSQLL
jgi:hypothetical protein